MVLFKKEKEKNNIPARKAAGRTFAFFLLALLSHAIYIFFKDFTLNASFYIMIAGLVFFFVNDYWLGRFSEREESKEF
ncbi:hypothetical protein M4S82_10840 [Planococcus sp. MERTA32b]|nr:hypothetical protein [Planococcus sp. MER TA 32b]